MINLVCLATPAFPSDLKSGCGDSPNAHTVTTPWKFRNFGRDLPVRYMGIYLEMPNFNLILLCRLCFD